MKLYRFAGRAELFEDCGYLPIDHTVRANLAELTKTVTIWRAKARKEKREHRVYIEIIHIETLNQSIIAAALTLENTEMLVKESGRLKEWEWKRDG